MARFIWTPEALTELAQLHEAGAGTTELAEALGTTPPTIRRKLAQLAADAGGGAALVGFAPAEAEQADAPSVDDLPGVTTEDVNAALAALEAPADEQPEDEGPTEDEAHAMAAEQAEAAPSSDDKGAPAEAETEAPAAAPKYRWHALAADEQGQPLPVAEVAMVEAADEQGAGAALAGFDHGGFVVRENSRGQLRYDYGGGWAVTPEAAVALAKGEPAPGNTARAPHAPASAPATPGVDKQPKAPAAPRQRSRVDVTIDAMRRPEGVTVAELAELFASEFGDGKLSTASQAIYKAPASRKLKHFNTGEKRDGKAVYRIDA